MIPYREQYAQYLGCNVDDERPISICHSPLRDKVEKQRKPFILSFWNQHRRVISTSWDLETSVRSLVDSLPATLSNLDDWIRIIDDFLFDIFQTYKVERYFRMTVEEKNLVAAVPSLELVRPLTLDDKEMIYSQKRVRNRGDKVKEYMWSYDSRWIREGKLFAIVENGSLASEASITEVEFNGGNIAVDTNEDCRRKGFGKAVVHRATTWCFQNSIVPIYWVNADNTASITLAKSLGFQVMNVEIVVSHWPGDAMEKYKNKSEPT